MGVEQDVRHHAALCEGHVLCWPQTAQDALLTMATSKLVTNGGVSWHSDSDAHTFETAYACVVAADFDVVDNASLLAPKTQWSRCKLDVSKTIMLTCERLIITDYQQHTWLSITR